MERIRLDPAIERPDDFYHLLVDAYEHLSAEELDRFRDRLILILANQLGDQDMLAEAIGLAARVAADGDRAAPG